MRFISPAGFTNGLAGVVEEEGEGEEGLAAAAAALLPATAMAFAAEVLGEV